MLLKLIVILGPTASGKTDLALRLARKFNGEIVCADSRQIYAGMTIGTAKPYGKGRPSLLKKGRSALPIFTVQAVPHHLFGIIKPNQTFNVAQYQKLAIKAIKDIQKRGKTPFLVGGTAFYIYSVVEGWQFPKSKANPELRKQLEIKSPAELFQILQKLDRQRIKNIDKNNTRRLIRAIEIAKEFGKVPSITKKPQFDCLILGIKPNKTELQKRISQRVEKMFKMGLEKEVETLIKKYSFNIPPMQTIGYQEFKNYFTGEITKKELVALISLHTRQFAKRQMTWFKKDKRIRWVKNHQQTAALIKKFTEAGPCKP